MGDTQGRGKYDQLNTKSVPVKNTSSSQKVVLVRLGNTGLQSLGIMTREYFSDLPFTIPTQDKVVVFIPYSYGVGGFSVLVHKDDLTPIDLPLEKVMSLRITAEVKKDHGGG